MDDSTKNMISRRLGQASLSAGIPLHGHVETQGDRGRQRGRERALGLGEASLWSISTLA